MGSLTAFTLLLAMALLAAPTRATVPACGVAITIQGEDIMTDWVQLLNLATGRMEIVQLHPDPNRVFFTVTELGAIYFFSPGSAFSIDVASGNMTNYPTWTSPFAMNGPVASLLQFAGYDAAKNIIYAFFQNEVNGTMWSAWASDMVRHKWNRLFNFELPPFYGGYDFAMVLSADATQIYTVFQDNTLEMARVSTFEIATGQWSPTNHSFSLKFPYFQAPLFTDSNNDVIMWMQTSASVYVAGAFSTATGDQMCVLSHHSHYTCSFYIQPHDLAAEFQPRVRAPEPHRAAHAEARPRARLRSEPAVLPQGDELHCLPARPQLRRGALCVHAEDPLESICLRPRLHVVVRACWLQFLTQCV